MDNGEIQIHFLHGIINKKEQISNTKGMKRFVPFFCASIFMKLLFGFIIDYYLVCFK